MVASFLTGSLLTLFIPVGLLIVVGLYWWAVVRRRGEF
jgi:cytochrome c-type biogenesis protein CcmH/NrfF